VRPDEAKHPRQRHPGPDCFRVFLQGRSEGDDARQIVRHLLAGCPECGRRLTTARDTAIAGKALSYDAVFDRLERRVTGTLERRQIEEKSAPELYEELFRHEAIEGLIQVHSTRRYASIALCELLLQKSREIGSSAPGEAQVAARLAVAVAEQLDLDLYGSPVVQDLRALTWAYVGDVKRVMADLRSARSCLDLAERLIEEGTGDPLLQAELLSLEASFLCQSGDFEQAVRLLNRASSIYRRTGDRHLAGRTMIKKGTVLGNAGEAETAARLIRRGIDLIDLPREPRLMVYAVHNLIWFLHDTGDRAQSRACLDGARSLYRQGRDRRQLGRLRWLEGKLASADPEFGAEKAEGALAEAQETLIKEGLSYEAALAAVDLACVYAGAGRGAEMRRQAAQILPLFQAGDMYRETVTALMTFQKCQGDVNPAALLRELGGYIHRVRDEKNPKWLVSTLLKAGPRPALAP
jgi:tetratricopeptide (TPR) repeat protein